MGITSENISWKLDNQFQGPKINEGVVIVPYTSVQVCTQVHAVIGEYSLSTPWKLSVCVSENSFLLRIFFFLAVNNSELQVIILR